MGCWRNPGTGHTVHGFGGPAPYRNGRPLREEISDSSKVIVNATKVDLKGFANAACDTDSGPFSLRLLRGLRYKGFKCERGDYDESGTV